VRTWLIVWAGASGLALLASAVYAAGVLVVPQVACSAHGEARMRIMRQEVLPPLTALGAEPELASDCSSGDSASVSGDLPDGTELADLYPRTEGWSRITVADRVQALAKETEEGLVVVGITPPRSAAVEFWASFD
jgi:hypothetical protein